MKIAHSMKMFAGSVAVYAAVAAAYACTGNAGSGSAGRGGIADGSGGSSTSVEPSVDTVGAGPVSPALADPTPGLRLQSQYRTGDDGSRQWAGWFDTVLGAPCGWMRLSDGKDHCVPGYHALSGMFADSACTRQVARLNACNDELGHGRAVGDRNPSQCPHEISVFELEPQPLTPGSTIYAFNIDGMCVAYQSTVMVAGERDYPTRSEVPPSEFVTSSIGP